METPEPPSREIVFLTGLSGSGKGTALRGLEDAGYYAVDNLPVELIPKFAELIEATPSIRRAALVVDIRETAGLARFPAIFEELRERLRARLLFLEADDTVLLTRFSETRRPHPLAADGAETVTASIARERELLEPVRGLATWIVNTTRFNVHELRNHVVELVAGGRPQSKILIAVNSFGFKHGAPTDSDLVFDVRFLPNPNYEPALKHLTGQDAPVAEYIQRFDQTREFLARVSGLLEFLIPHYIGEGKSYLTIAFGCTGGRHRSVMMAEHIRERLSAKGYRVKTVHRDIGRV